MSMLPKGGETIWGDLDWSPEEGFDCQPKRDRNDVAHDFTNSTAETQRPAEKPLAHYGRIISFGKDAAELPSSEIEMKDYKVIFYGESIK
jgi:phospholipid:diacylglycerol acyltransferase